MAQHDEMMNPSLWRPSSRSPPTYPQNVPSQSNNITPGSSRLEHFRNRQEAAISFEDDLEFNPSLTPDELSEARRHLVSIAVSHPPSPSSPRGSRSSHSSSPMLSTRAIPIIDPTKMTPLSLPTPPPKTTRSPPQQYMRPTANTSSTSNFSSIFSSSQPASVNPYSPQAEWASAWEIKSQQQNRVNIPTRSIPIVDPNNGSILNATIDRRAYYPMPAQQQRMVGAGFPWFDVTVR